MPRRRSMRIPNYDYSLPGGYFVTVCTEARRDILHGPIAAMVEAELVDLESRVDLTLDYHVVMADHVHAILMLRGHVSLWAAVGAFKSRSTNQIHHHDLARGKIWQRGYFDHVVRDEEDLLRIRRYIQENPLAEHVAQALWPKKDEGAAGGGKPRGAGASAAGGGKPRPYGR